MLFCLRFSSGHGIFCFHFSDSVERVYSFFKTSASLSCFLSPQREWETYSFHLTCWSWNIIAIILFFPSLILLLLVSDYKPVESYERHLSEPRLQLLSKTYIKMSRNFPGEEMGNRTFKKLLLLF